MKYPPRAETFGGWLAPLRLLAPVSAALLLTSATLSANPLVYSASGTAKGKKLVFIASDHEYRSEETVPALARILAKHHGFDCTVLFGLDEKGEIQGGSSNIPGMEAVEKADGLVIFARFLAPAPEQMKHLDAYLQRGGPVVGLRTSTHGFSYGKKDDPFFKYHYKYEGPDFRLGFGHQILGQTWVGHYGKNHQQSTRITPLPEKASHPILRGVKDVHIQAGAYTAEPGTDWNILTLAQPLNGMEAGAPGDDTKKPMASEWTRTYTAANGKTGRVFTSLYGASEDIVNPGYRRMILNGVYWSVGLEDQIQADSEVGFVGPYKPNTFSFGGYAKGVKPADYANLSSPIPAHNNVVPPAKPAPKPAATSAETKPQPPAAATKTAPPV